MGSVTCERCGFVSFATSEVCKQCGGPLPGPSAARNWRPPHQPQPNWQPQPQGAPDWQPQPQAYAGQQQQAHAGQWPPPAQGWLPPPPHGGSAHYQSQPGYYDGADDGMPKRKGVAVVSLLCGLLALPVMIVGAVAAIEFGPPAAILGGAAGLLMTILSLTLGIAGTVRVNKNPAEFGGKGMAVAGIVLGSLLLVGIVPVGIIAAIAVPNLMASMRAANEGAAIGTLRTMSEAQSTYLATAGGNAEYGEFDDLIRHRLIGQEMTTEVHHGYRYELTVAGDSYEMTATPVEYGKSGMRSFYVSEDGVVRGANKNGEAADKNDPPITSGGYGDPATADADEEVEWTEEGPVMRRASSRPNGGR